MCFWTRIARIWRIIICVRITIREFGKKHDICFYAELISQKNAFLLPSPHIHFLTQESLFCHQREPLFFKSGKSDFFCSKKFAMSLIRAIFAFGNGREMANLVLVFLCATFALASLLEAKKSTRQCGSRDKAQTRVRSYATDVLSPRHSANPAWFALCTRLIENVLWHICLLVFLKTRWVESLREFGVTLLMTLSKKWRQTQEILYPCNWYPELTQYRPPPIINSEHESH